MTPEEVKLFHEGIQNGIDTISKDYSRLKMKEKEFNAIKDILWYSVCNHGMATQIVITIPESAKMMFKDFKEVLENSEWNPVK